MLYERCYADEPLEIVAESPEDKFRQALWSARADGLSGECVIKTSDDKEFSVNLFYCLDLVNLFVF